MWIGWSLFVYRAPHPIHRRHVERARLVGVVGHGFWQPDTCWGFLCKLGIWICRCLADETARYGDSISVCSDDPILPCLGHPAHGGKEDREGKRTVVGFIELDVDVLPESSYKPKGMRVWAGMV